MGDHEWYADNEYMLIPSMFITRVCCTSRFRGCSARYVFADHQNQPPAFSRREDEVWAAADSPIVETSEAGVLGNNPGSMSGRVGASGAPDLDLELAL